MSSKKDEKIDQKLLLQLIQNMVQKNENEEERKKDIKITKQERNDELKRLFRGNKRMESKKTEKEKKGKQINRN
jgi:hypothetical protein